MNCLRANERRNIHSARTTLTQIAQTINNTLIPIYVSHSDLFRAAITKFHPILLSLLLKIRKAGHRFDRLA